MVEEKDVAVKEKVEEEKKKAAKKPEEKAEEKPKKKAAKKPEEKAPEKPKKKAAKKPEEKAPEKPKKKAAKKPEEKAPEKPKKKAAKKPEEKAPEKPKKKAAKKPEKKAPEKPKKKAAKKPEEKAPEKPEEEVEEEEKKEKPAKKEHKIEKIKFYEKRKLHGEEKRLFSFAYKQKKKKPRFARQEVSFRKRLDDVWRRPKGIDSKQLEEKRGKGKIPKVGYKTPRLVSGLHPTGYRPVLVHNVSGLNNLNHKIEAAIISATVGRKKRNEIIITANEKRIVILNPRKGEIVGKRGKKALSGKKILMIIAPKDFRDEELKTPKEIFENNGAKVTVASTAIKTAAGQLGAKVKPDIEISKIDVENYDTIIFVGGSGAQKHLWDNKEVQKIAKESYEKGKVTGAICLASVILARAGILEGKNATVFKSDEAIAELENNKVKYSKKRVVASDNIVTGNGPEAAKAFAMKVVEMGQK